MQADADPERDQTDGRVKQRVHVGRVQQRDDHRAGRPAAATARLPASRPWAVRPRPCGGSRSARGPCRRRGRSPRPCCRRSRAAVRRRSATCWKSSLFIRSRDLPERIRQRDADLLVGDRPPELALRRLGRVLDDGAQRPDEGLTGAHRRGDDLEVVRQLLGEQATLSVRPASDHEHVHADRHGQRRAALPSGCACPCPAPSRRGSVSSDRHQEQLLGPRS